MWFLVPPRGSYKSFYTCKVVRSGQRSGVHGCLGQVRRVWSPGPPPMRSWRWRAVMWRPGSGRRCGGRGQHTPGLMGQERRKGGCPTGTRNCWPGENGWVGMMSYDRQEALPSRWVPTPRWWAQHITSLLLAKPVKKEVQSAQIHIPKRKRDIPFILLYIFSMYMIFSNSFLKIMTFLWLATSGPFP